SKTSRHIVAAQSSTSTKRAVSVTNWLPSSGMIISISRRWPITSTTCADSGGEHDQSAILPRRRRNRCVCDLNRNSGRRFWHPAAWGLVMHPWVRADYRRRYHRHRRLWLFAIAVAAGIIGYAAGQVIGNRNNLPAPAPTTLAPLPIFSHHLFERADDADVNEILLGKRGRANRAFHAGTR